MTPGMLNSSRDHHNKARGRKLPLGYFRVRKPNTVTTARHDQINYLGHVTKNLSEQHTELLLPRNDTIVVVSDNEIDMLDTSEQSNSSSQTDVTIPESSSSTSSTSIRKRALSDSTETLAILTAGQSVKSSIAMSANTTPSEKRHKGSKPRFARIPGNSLDEDEAIERPNQSTDAATVVSNSAKDKIGNAKTTHTETKTNISSFFKVTKYSPKSEKVVSAKKAAERKINTAATENASESTCKAAVDMKKPSLAGSRAIRSRRVTKKIYVTKDFLARWQVKPVKRPFRRPKMISDKEINPLLTGVTETVNLETDWFSDILGSDMPGFQDVLPFFATFEFDPDIDDKILKGLKASAMDKDLEGVAEMIEELGGEDEDETSLNQFQPTKASKDHMIWNGLDLSMPPIHSLPDIFEDMVSKGLDEHNNQQLQDVVDYLGGRTLRVGTMCSGTECPILAFGMINDALICRGRNIISFVHVLSCEIEPFKQAYIQRNFNPKFLFRDVAELPQCQASTAYGSPVDIPGNLDMLIAGSSCKDYSGLNNKKKTFDEDGQSRSTFQGVLGYAERYTPRIVILENVDGAPWPKIQAAWDEIGYETFVSKVDTKDYYIPQTRRRGYMVGFNRAIARLVDFPFAVAAKSWSKLLERYARRASSPFTKFIYSQDDPRLHQIQRELAISMSLEKARKKVEWIKCRHRYMSFRAAHGLGFRKPLTIWENNGTCKFPDGSWLNWAKCQVERVWDTVDINFLRCVSQRDYDLQYKSREVELSQNVDRDNDTRPWGIIGCITPSGIPYLTSQNRPIIGQESLALQGIPTDALSLAYETSRQLQDFAGNAMTSTVVGAAILAALGVGHKILERGLGAHEALLKGQDTPLQELILSWTGQTLIEKPLFVGPISSKTFRDMRMLASCTLQLCSCEGRFECKRGTFQHCPQCGHRTCTTCGQNPLHKYEPIPASVSEQRRDPSEFEAAMREWLPLQFSFRDIDYTCLSEIGDVVEGSTEARTLAAIRDALENTVHLTRFSRTESWTAIYESTYARLEIVFARKWDCQLSSSKTIADLLDEVIVQCYLYAKTKAEEPANSSIRLILEPPIARMTCNNSSELEGSWTIRIPKKAAFELRVEYLGEHVDSWEKKLGLTDTMFSHRQVSKQLRLSCLADTWKVCPKEIVGLYQLLEDCGTACGSLYRKLDDTDLSSGGGLEPVFFFLDPGGFQNAAEDSLVFATTHHQPLLDGTRDVIAEAKKGWRPVLNLPSTPEVLSCSVSGVWQSMRNTRLALPERDLRIQRWVPSPDASAHINFTRCTEPDFIAFVCSFPMQKDRQKQWIPRNVYPINMVDKPNALGPFTQLIQRAGRDCGFTEWVKIMPSVSVLALCKTCAPTKPRLLYPTLQSTALAKYVKSNSDKPFLVEDQRQAFEFERRIRARPSPVVADLHCHEDGTGTLKVQLNPATLIHRAYAKLVSQMSNGAPISSVQWRLATDSGFEQLLPFPKLSLLSNAGDPEADMPPNWNGDKQLHKPQLRSLRWMLEQESARAENWVEQETEEARIPCADLRLEAKVECERHVRGGVLADEVGYGKTAVTLALFDSDASGPKREQRHPEVAFAKGDRKIRVKATLVLAPANLLDQWHNEVKCFLKPGYKVVIIQSEMALLTEAFEEIADADIILSTWEVFGDRYFEELAYFGRAPQVPKQHGRAFKLWLNGAVENVGTLVEYSDGCKSKMWPVLRTLGVIQSTHHAPDTTIATVETVKNKLDNKTMEILEGQFKLVDMKDRKDLKIAPLLHFFSFHRIVTDEFTYVKEKHLSSTLLLAAPRKWILSGTPPLGSFREINSMAMFLGTKLSTDDNDGGVYESQAALKEKMKDKTEAEKFNFYSYQTLHSQTWYHERNKLAEKFAMQFIRRNPPDLTVVPLSIHYEVVSLSAAERATYFELFQLLMNRPMSFSTSDKKDTKPKEGEPGRRDRTMRLIDMASNSRSPEEALLICCSTSMSAVNGVKSYERTASRVCRAIVAEKKKHFYTTVQELIERLAKVFELWELGYKDDATVIPHFHSYIRSLHNNEFGDQVAKTFLERVMAYAQAAAAKTAFNSKLIPSAARNAVEPGTSTAGSLNTSTKGSADEDDCEQAVTKGKNSPPNLCKLAPRKRFIYLEAAELTNLSFRITEHLRGLRFFNVVEGYVSDGLIPRCSACLVKAPDAEKTLIMGLCGHASCIACIEKKRTQRKLLDECVAVGCEAPAQSHTAFRLSDLDRGTSDLQSPLGSKIDAVLELLQDDDRVRTEDRVVIFVQFERLKAALIEGLRAVNVTYVDGFHKGKVEQFKERTDKVCILDPESVNAAGWNLQMANHVIFLSSLVTDTQYKYESMMTQARGRVYRQGQKKAVHVYHFLAARTIDVNILQERTGNTLVQRNGKYLLLPESEIQEGDERGFTGAPFEGAACRFED